MGCMLVSDFNIYIDPPLFLFQILFMVGKGYLKPDITYAHSDTPVSFKRIMQSCIKFPRDERPPFQQVRAIKFTMCLVLYDRECFSFSDPSIVRTFDEMLS